MVLTYISDSTSAQTKYALEYSMATHTFNTVAHSLVQWQNETHHYNENSDAL